MYYFGYWWRKTFKLKKSELNKACFKHDIVKNNFKDLPARKASDKPLYNKAFEFISNPKYDKCQRSFTSVVLQNFGWKSPTQTNQLSAASGTIKRKIILNQQLVYELQKPVIWNFNKKQYIFIF